MIINYKSCESIHKFYNYQKNVSLEFFQKNETRNEITIRFESVEHIGYFLELCQDNDIDFEIDSTMTDVRYSQAPFSDSHIEKVIKILKTKNVSMMLDSDMNIVARFPNIK